MAAITPVGAPVATTDFQRELGRLDDEIERLSAGNADERPSRHDAIRLLSLRYQRAKLLGSWAELGLVETSLVALVQRLGPLPDLCLLDAMLHLTLHRLGAVRAALARSPVLAGSWHGRALEADVLVQEGRYEDARVAYEGVVREARTWENLARLAHVRGLTGHRAVADGLYAEAAEEITAKEMCAYAWVEVARGELALTHGDHKRAGEHFERAGAAYSGYWLVDVHLAEVLGAQGHADRAVALLEEVVARAPRPELVQALGDLHARDGRADEARTWHERALADYLESAHGGEVHYLHHLTEFCADVLRDGPQAVQWAQRDFELRPNAITEAALAWAEYRDGRFGEALRHIRHAIASGVCTPQVLRQYAAIHRACGDVVIDRQRAAGFADEPWRLGSTGARPGAEAASAGLGPTDGA